MKNTKVKGIIISLIIGISVGAGSTYIVQKGVYKDDIETIQTGEDMASLINGNILAVDWQQNSGEINALRYEAYNSGKDYVSKLSKEKSDKPYAVTLDIDETILDNSPHAGYQIKNGVSYTPENFHKWVEKASAKAIAGSKAFTDFAKSKGFEVFYVSNRDEKTELDSTIKNMKDLGFVDSDKDHILLKTDTNNKKGRWDKIKEKYNLAIYCGDNLGDFPNGYDKQSNEKRNEIVSKEKDNFGTKYIVLPNSAYGDFEGAIYSYDYSKSPSEKLKDRLSVIKSFE